MTGKTKTVFTPLEPSMVTLGMMCLVITAITILVLKVRGIVRFICMLIVMSQIVLLDILKIVFIGRSIYRMQF